MKGDPKGDRKNPAKRPAKVERTETAKSKYIHALAAGMLSGEAARAAGVNRVTPYRWRTEDPVFAAEAYMAERAGVAEIENVALQGATIGWEKPIFFNGMHVATVRERNPTLVMFMLKARDPLRYCDRARTEMILRGLDKEAKDKGEDTSATASEKAIAALERIASEKSGGHGTD